MGGVIGRIKRGVIARGKERIKKKPAIAKWRGVHFLQVLMSKSHEGGAA